MGASMRRTYFLFCGGTVNATFVPAARVPEGKRGGVPGKVAGVGCEVARPGG